MRTAMMTIAMTGALAHGADDVQSQKGADARRVPVLSDPLPPVSGWSFTDLGSFQQAGDAFRVVHEPGDPQSRMSDPLRPQNLMIWHASSAGSFHDAKVTSNEPRVSDPLRPANQIRGDARSLGEFELESEAERYIRIDDPFEESLLVGRGGQQRIDDQDAQRRASWASSVPTEWRVLGARRRGLVIEGVGEHQGALRVFRMIRTDLNADGASDAFDTIIFIRAFELGASDADLNGDGSVDIFDMLEFIEAHT